LETTNTANSEAVILARLVQADGHGLSPEAARAILKLAFGQADRDRMHELAVKNQEDALTEEEQQELDSYRRIGRFLDLLSAQARLSLQKHGLTA
jgi:hypothetical protein